MSDFKKLYVAKSEIITNYLSSLFPDSSEIPEPLYGSMKYMIGGGGKRIRPILTLATAEMFSPTLSDVLTFASAIELIHTYSLIHDDLPCMDDDDMRRNRPTCHMIYGEGMAVLTGDAFLNLAYEQIFKGMNKCTDKNRYLRAATILANNVGARGMIAGQCYDLQYESCDTVTENELYLVHKNKTSKLIEAAVLCGAIVAGATEQEECKLQAFAQKLGLVFQITDDILDVVGDSSVFGKPTGSDIESDKLTFPKIFGVENSRRLCDKYIDEGIACLSVFNEKADFLRDLATDVLCRIK